MTAHVQSKLTEVAAAVSATVVLDAAPTQGNLLIAIATWSAAVNSPVYPWGATPDVNTGIGGVGLAIMAKVAGAGESATVTFSNNTSRALTLSVIEVSPTAGRRWQTTPIDKSATASNGAATTLTIGPTTTLDEADDISVAALGGTGTLGATQTFTTPAYTNVVGTDSSTRGFTGYRILTASGTPQVTATWTTSRSVQGAIATYKQENIPPAGNPGAGFLALL